MVPCDGPNRSKRACVCVSVARCSFSLDGSDKSERSLGTGELSAFGSTGGGCGRQCFVARKQPTAAAARCGQGSPWVPPSPDNRARPLLTSPAPHGGCGPTWWASRGGCWPVQRRARHSPFATARTPAKPRNALADMDITQHERSPQEASSVGPPADSASRNTSPVPGGRRPDRGFGGRRGGRLAASVWPWLRPPLQAASASEPLRSVAQVAPLDDAAAKDGRPGRVSQFAVTAPSSLSRSPYSPIPPVPCPLVPRTLDGSCVITPGRHTLSPMTSPASVLTSPTVAFHIGRAPRRRCGPSQSARAERRANRTGGRGQPMRARLGG